MASTPIADEICVQDLASIKPKERVTMIEKVARIEKKAFPPSEAFDFNMELKKRNTNMTLALKKGVPIGYLVYLRQKRLTLLHKICVIEQERGKGVGKCLMHSLRNQLEKAGCDSIHLWVDETRQPARSLYDSCGFQQIDRCLDYYGPGRTGLKMQLSIDRDGK
ncbi:acyl-CoA N-acyltransferase [Byssothecium circinans]|uniref:Acyl-CoA N-acyltransferase n=1 Tax=Byssothecium circinans TaxID=147558 RepID=A0A6A5U611_9PLEO|nr:acyl-CoA N-acyltransferase [Byssothecium circinans]